MPPQEITPQEHPTEPLLEAQLVQSRQIGDETNGLLEALVAQGDQNNPEPILEAQLIASGKNTDRIVEAIGTRPEVQQVKIVTDESELADNFFRMLRGQKGEKGDQGEKGDSVRGEQGPQGEQGPEGERGADGLDGKDGENGRDGRDGNDGQDGKDGRDGKDGVSPTIDYKKVVAETVKKLPKTDLDKAVAEITERVSQNTNETLQIVRSKVASRSYAMAELTDVQGATVGQVMIKQADGSWAPGAQTGGGGSLTVETPTGAIDDVNVTYTVTAIPKYISYGGATLWEGANGYTRTGLTITMPYPPTPANADQFKSIS